MTISPDVVAAWVNSPEFLQSYHWRRVRISEAERDALKTIARATP